MSATSKAYEEAQSLLRMKDLNVAYIVALILMPLGFSIDYIVYSDVFLQLTAIRSISVVLLLITYILYKAQRKNRFLGIFENIWAIIIILTLCIMIYITGGVKSSYYAAINLVIVGSAFLLPLTLSGALVIFSVATLSYVVTVVIHSSSDFFDFGSDLYNNLYFIVLTGIIGCIASFFNEKRRFSEFSLRYELDERNKELSQLDRIKSEFFANVSHELRTPLTLIISPIEDILQLECSTDSEIRKLLLTIRDNGYRLLKLVNDLLGIVRLDEQNALERKPVQLYTLICGIVDSLRHIAKKQQVDLVVDPEFASATVVGDISAIEKIFVNLLNNAIKFTNSGGLVTVSSSVSRNEIAIKVADTGIGIDHKNLPRIFERFKQADSSATRKYQGTGLGLALVKELTVAQGGRIEVDSQIGEGTVFTVSFPTIEHPETENKEQLTVDANTQLKQDLSKTPLEQIHQRADYSLFLKYQNTSSLTSYGVEFSIDDQKKDLAKLLIVEDEPDLRNYLIDTLSPNYSVISAADGQEGLSLVKKFRPELVLLDIMLPKLDGLELCKRIKKSKDLQLTKIMLLTARIDEKSKLTALENGADDFLTKPFSTIEIKTRLRNLWRSHQLEKDLEVRNDKLKKSIVELKAMEGKLIQSEKLNALGSLAAGLLHEVNNPLNYAITATQILQRNKIVRKDEDLSELIDDVYEGMERIRLIVKDLHTFAYPDNAIKQQPFALAEAVESSLRFTACEIGDTEIKVDVPDNIVVLGSQSHIVQVLINLVTNAIKAVKGKEDGSVRIGAKHIVNDSKIKRILVSVYDNGIGIGNDILQRIFDPFFTTRDVGDGLGMGLSICHSIIESHGGTMAVSSQKGKFTELSFDLALADGIGEY